MSEFEATNEELFEMVNNHASAKGEPVKCVIVPVSTVQAYQRQDINRQQSKRIAVVAARASLGVLCIGAMARDMMSPGLAVLAVVACCAWAAAGYWRGGHAKVYHT